MASSWWRWMVATMSRICAPRLRVRAAMSAPSPSTTMSSGASGTIRSSSAPTTVGALAAQHPAAQHAHRVDRGGAVEGGGRRRAPVDDERLVVVVAHPEPADVADLALVGGGAVGLARPARGRAGRRPGPRTACRSSSGAGRRRRHRASRSKSPVISSSRTSPVREVRPRAIPSASTSAARGWPSRARRRPGRRGPARAPARGRRRGALGRRRRGARGPGALVRRDDAFEVLTENEGL